jgi:hypothetical protein
MAEEFHIVFGTDGPVRVGRDEFAEQWPYRTKSPAWYAARQAHNIGCLDPERWSDMLASRPPVAASFKTRR